MQIIRKQRGGERNDFARHALASPILVAYQGEPGAYSFEAARSFFGTQIGLCPYPTFEQVCQAVVAGQTWYGILPIANSQTGPMGEIERLMTRFSLVLLRKIGDRVNHCLLCLPGQTISEIVIVISHPQALMQCRRYLKRLGVQTTETSNTAASAKLIRDKQLKGFAAIASAHAASIYLLIHQLHVNLRVRY